MSSFLDKSSFATKRDIAPTAFAMPNLGPAPDRRKDERRFNCSKQESPQWKKLKAHRGSIKTNGKSGKAARYYEWDYTHNDIEEYGPGPRYEHRGSIDPINGDRYRAAVKDRNLKDELK